MANLVVEQSSVELDQEGFLVHLEDWSETVATHLAAREGIELTADHWQVIRLLRQFYQDYEISPAMRALVKYVGQQLGKDKGSSLYLLTLFPVSPAKIGSKIAGLPKPDNCL